MFGKKHIIAIVSRSILEDSARSLICAPLNLATTMPPALRNQNFLEILTNAHVLQNFQVFLFPSSNKCYLDNTFSLMDNKTVRTSLARFLYDLIVHCHCHACTGSLLHVVTHRRLCSHLKTVCICLHSWMHCGENQNKFLSCFFPT